MVEEPINDYPFLYLREGFAYKRVQLPYVIIDRASFPRGRGRYAGWFDDRLVLVYPRGEAISFKEGPAGEFRWTRIRVTKRERLMAHLITGWRW